MKNFANIKTALVLLGVLITGITNQTWAYGYYTQDGHQSEVRFWFNDNVSKSNCALGATAGVQDWSATPCDKLLLAGFTVWVWRDKDKKENITYSKIYYRFYRSNEAAPGYNILDADHAHEEGGNNQTWYTDNTVDLFTTCNVNKGGEFYFDYYFYTDGAEHLSNNSTQYRIKFTVKNRVFATDYTDDGGASWSTSARQFTNGKYVLSNVAASKTIKFKIPFYNSPDNWTRAFGWDAVGSNTSLGNTTLSEVGSNDNIQFTTPSGSACNVLVTFTGSAVKVDCNPRYSVSVAAGAHGRVSTSSVSGIDKVAVSSDNITATPDDGYYFTGWTLPSGVTAAEGYTNKSNPIKIHATAASKTITANFARKWTIKGGNSDSEDGTDAMGDWKIYYDLEETSTNVFEGTIDLAANTTYRFKVVDAQNDVYYGYGDDGYFLSYAGQSSDNGYDLAGGKNNLRLMSAGAGTYKFTYNSSTKRLKVTFPTTVTHPSTDYIYFRHTQGWKHDSYVVLAHVFGGNQSNGERMMVADSMQFDGKWYYYTALGDNDQAIFAGSQNTTTYKTENLTDLGSAGTRRGKYYDVTSGANQAARWHSFTQTVTLNNQGATTAGAANVVATYGASMPSITSSLPEKTGYTFGGYFASTGGSGKQYYNADGTSANAWDQTGAEPSIYAKWTANAHTITFDEQGATTHGNPTHNGTRSVTYDASTGMTNITIPQKEGYTFAGYWNSSTCDDKMLINASGAFVETTGFIVDGKWVYDGDPTIYAKWDITSTYYFKGGKSGSETAWDEEDNWTKGAVPGSTSDVILLAPVDAPASATTTVNSIKIANAGSYTPNGGSAIPAAGKLTIPATGMLIVTTSVSNYDLSTSATSSTTPATLHIQSASSGNGALVWGTSGTPGKAQVDFYTKSSGNGTTSDINQYIGTPFSDANVLYNYYDAWTFKVNDDNTAWERLNGGDEMNPFVGYNVIYNGAAGHIFEMEGTLVTNATRENIMLPFTSSGAENLLANSWVAPIKIANFKEDDFVNTDVAIYIFNSTSEKASDEDKTPTGGNYSAYSPGTSRYEIDFIPSMQSFSVLANTGESKVTLDYDRLVKSSPSHENIVPNYAPSRFASNEMDRLTIRVHSENGWGDELKICIREDFTNAFESGYDARKMYGDWRAPSLYGFATDGIMAINCIPTADNQAIGFHAGSADSQYTFTFSYDGNDDLYLLDTKLNLETKMDAEHSYTFLASTEDSDMRFVIIQKAPGVATGTEEVTGDGLQGTGAQKIMHNGTLYIIRAGKIYDGTGSLVK